MNDQDAKSTPAQDGMPTLDKEVTDSKKPSRKPRAKAKHTADKLAVMAASKMSDTEKDLVIKTQREHITLLENKVTELERSVQSANTMYKNADAAYHEINDRARVMIEKLRTMHNANSFAIGAILQNGVNG